MVTKSDPKDSLRNKWAKVHAHKAIIDTWNKQVKDYNEKIKPGLKPPGPIDGMILIPLHEEDIPLELPPTPDFWKSFKPPAREIGADPPADLTVCIVGAGPAGLFTGMIFDYIKSKITNFNVTYQILEAAESGPYPSPFSPVQRAGRLFSYSWETGDTMTPRLYYDVGAMRYPQNLVMQRTFDLFSTLGMKFQALTPTTQAGALVPYYLQNVESPSQPPPVDAVVQEWWRFNDITVFGDLNQLSKSAPGNDAFTLNTDGQIPTDCLLQTSYFESLIQDLKTALETQPWETAWQTLMGYDKQSTRTYLEQSKGCTYETVQYLEMLNGGSGWYDQALSEAVLESIDFDYDPPSKTTIPWWCIVGGSAQLARNMTDSLKVQPQYGQRVTRIDWNNHMDTSVYTNGSLTPTTYAAVFNSTTMGCLRMMNTLNAGFSYEVKEAMRALSYGPSAKVGVIFSEPWWMSKNLANPILSGGQAHSDLIIRTCVYPSYNFDTQSGNHVLLCSYTWQQDATRISSMMCGTNNNNLDHKTVVANEANLKERILRDLAHLHTTTPLAADTLYEVINGLYVDHYSHDWNNDPNTAGAFAFFGPDQFSKLWPKIIAPTNDVVIIGEHASPHHAWVVGALESALVGVYQWLTQYAKSGLIVGVQDALNLLQGTETGNPFISLPGYYTPNTADWHALSAFVEKELTLLERKAAKEGKSS